ncbi:MAG: hypothetical protein K6F34_09325 [Lachnospiraceae bacterium]|nr:hypothetical protein [Lachnospiraceae bacterium]
MAKVREWNFATNDGRNVKVAWEKKNIRVNDGEPVKLTSLKSAESSVLETVYEIGIGNGESAKLCLSTLNGKNKILTYNGRDVETGMEHEIPVVPNWIYVFFALFIVNWFLIVGGALGVLINMGGFALCGKVASKQDKSTGYRVLMCAIIYVGFTLLGLGLAIGLRVLLDGMR